MTHLYTIEPPSVQRCAECDCENGGSDCNWIKPGAEVSVQSAARELLEATQSPVFDRLKPLMIGEHCVKVSEFDEDGGEYARNIDVPWSVQKDIISAALRALAQKEGE